jgi:hypothetical protein
MTGNAIQHAIMGEGINPNNGHLRSTIGEKIQAVALRWPQKKMPVKRRRAYGFRT